MKKVYQTIFGNATEPPLGNCMQAVSASLYELELDEVPHFVEEGDNWFQCYHDFIKSMGCEFGFNAYNPKMLGNWGEDRFVEIENYEGVNGFFEASVFSPKYFEFEKCSDPTYTRHRHAVIIDKEFNIVHDPNPNYKDIEKYPLADAIGYNGICDICFVNPIKVE